MDESAAPTDRESVLKWYFAARGQIEAGRRDLAHELLAECLALEPDNLLVAEAFVGNWRQIAETNPSKGKRLRWPLRDRSIRGAANRLKDAPLDPRTIRDLIIAWRAAASAGMLAVVLPPLSDALPAGESIGRRIVAEVLTEAGRCEEALAKWQELSDGEARDPMAVLMVDALQSIVAAGKQLGRADDGDSTAELAMLESRAAEALQQATATGIDLLKNLARQLETHHRDAAIDVFRQRVEQYPARHDYRRQLIIRLKETGNPAAVAAALETIPQPLDDSWLLTQLAEMHQRNRRFEQALGYYRQAVAHFGEHDPPTLRQRILQQARQLAEALGRDDLLEQWTTPS